MWSDLSFLFYQQDVSHSISFPCWRIVNEQWRKHFSFACDFYRWRKRVFDGEASRFESKHDYLTVISDFGQTIDFSLFAWFIFTCHWWLILSTRLFTSMQVSCVESIEWFIIILRVNAWHCFTIFAMYSSWRDACRWQVLSVSFTRSEMRATWWSEI